MALREVELVARRNEIHLARDNTELINGVFEQLQRGRIYNPIEDTSATQRLENTIDQWQSEGNVVVMSFGCYDAPFHANHQRFLFDCKLQGVAAYYERLADAHGDVPWTHLDTASRREFTRAALSDGVVKLIVSADGDKRVDASKSFTQRKGDSQRPLLGWQIRADNVLGLSLPIDENQSFRVPVVDAVTVHDHLALPGTIHADPVEMVAHFRPDVWALFQEAERDIDAASRDIRLRGTSIVVIGDTRGYTVTDPQTGRPFSTTDFVRRIKGGFSEHAASE